MRASVVVCTHNRADRLRVCIASLLAQQTPAEAFEIIIIDDGSTDHTPQTCAAFVTSGRVRVIHQKNAGLGAARDHGWRIARAPLIAFLDDDAEAPPGWLDAVLDRFENLNRLADPPAVLGGPARPVWELPRPPWLDDTLAAWLTVWEPYADYRESHEQGLFVGANMTFRRDALAAIGGFSASLGRRGDNLLSHEESEVWGRLRSAGLRSAYDPAAWVHHHIAGSRLRPAWFRRRIFWEGVSMTRRHRPPEDPARPGRALAVLLRAPLAKPVRDHLLHPSLWGASLRGPLHLAYCLGCAREWARPAP